MNLMKENNKDISDLLDNDEISLEEAAFMIGYFNEECQKI